MKKHLTFWSAIGLVYSILCIVGLYKEGYMENALKESHKEVAAINGKPLTKTQKGLWDGLCITLIFLLLWWIWPIVVICRRINEICDMKNDKDDWEEKKEVGKFSRYYIK